jgi:integrase/recombinase XerD
LTIDVGQDRWTPRHRRTWQPAQAVTTLPRRPSRSRPAPGDLFDARWERLVAGWLAQYRPATAAAYTADLKAWVHWAVARGLTLATAGPADIGAWARHLETAGARPAGLDRKLATLSSFCRWALAEDAITRNPLDRVRRPRIVDDAEALGLDRDQAARLLDAATNAGPRDHALICLLLLNGLRVSEACAARIDDLGASRGHVTLRIRRKAGREATIPLAAPTAAAVTATVGDRTTGRLLLDAADRPLDRHDAARIVARRSELPATHPHALRHTFVTSALDADASLRDVQDAAGHADPRTTRRYDRARYNLDRHPTYAVAARLSPTAAS